MRNKLAALGLVLACATVAMAGLSNVFSFTRHAQAVPESTPGISPADLHQQVDVNSLPVQNIADPI